MSFTWDCNEMVGMKKAWQRYDLEILGTWMVYDEMKWVGPETWKELA